MVRKFPRNLAYVIMLISSAVLAANCGGSGSVASSVRSSAASSSSSSLPVSTPTATANFISSSDEIANPERGFYRWAKTDLGSFSEADGADAYANGYRLVYTLVRLDAYKASPLPQALLDGLRSGFANARKSGVKVILRFAYNFPSGETEYKGATDAPIDQVLSHIAQLKPILQENGDVIAFFQAGFIGAWGEWHTSSNNLTDVDNRTKIRDALLDALPQNRFVQFRYPPYMMAWAPVAPAEADAFNGTPASRSGIHNDCFLASSTDVGTYSSDPAIAKQQRDYAKAVSKVAPFGGETCNPAAEPGAQSRTGCNDILTEGQQYSLTYLNGDYFVDIFHNRWKADGCYDQVKRLMGYRLELVSVEHSQNVVAGAASGLRFKISVHNVGWARVYNPHLLTLILKNKSSGQIIKINTPIDPRSWTPGHVFTDDVGVTVPPGTAAGAYDIFVALPDGAPSLVNDPRFSIRPANADNAPAHQGWDASLGAYRLGTTLAVD